MRKRSIVCLMVAFLLFTCLAATAQTVQKPMTNADVVAMVKSGISEDTIVLAIQKATTDFDTSPEAMIALKGQGVPEKVLAAMLSSQSGTGGTPTRTQASSPGAATQGQQQSPNPSAGNEQKASGIVELTGYSGVSFNYPAPAPQLSFSVNPNGSSGGSYGPGLGGGSSTHPLIGGSVAVSLNRNIWMYADGAYIPLGVGTASVSASLSVDTATSRGSAVFFHFGARYEFLPSLRLSPYVNGGVGLSRISSLNTTMGGGQRPVVSNTQIGTGTTEPSAQAGGGARIRISQRWGIRASLEAAVCRFNCPLFGIFSTGVYFQTRPIPPPKPRAAPNTGAIENGAIIVWGDGGFSYNVPAVRALVVTPTSFVESPQRKTLSTLSFGVGVKVGKYLVPFFQLTDYNTGSAFATNGAFTSTVKSTTLTYDLGLRVEGGSSGVRGYGEFGGGAVYQKLDGTFTESGISVPATGAAKTGNVMGGVGGRVFWGHSRWGSDVAMDVFHLTGNSSTVKNFALFRAGIFFQSKRAK
jgi:hypothetical protein